jgi:hypothetical protein
MYSSIYGRRQILQGTQEVEGRRVTAHLLQEAEEGLGAEQVGIVHSLDLPRIDELGRALLGQSCSGAQLNGLL